MNRDSRVPSGTTALVACILVAGISFAVGDIVGQRLPNTATWWILAVLLILLGIGHYRFSSARIIRNRQIARAFSEISEGSTAWRRTWASRVITGGLGEEVREALEELCDRVDALRREKRQAEQVLANMGDGVISVDSGGSISLFNRAASAFFGKKESQVLGQTLESAELHPEITRLAHECIATRSHLSAEITLPGETQRVLGIRATPFKLSSSSPDCAMIVLHDLTEIRRHERYQKEFASNVSHEMKTPITSVRSTAETLLAGARHDEEVVDRFLKTIISESDRLAALVDDVMEIAKFDSGIRKIEKAVSSVGDTVKKAVVVLIPQAEHKNQTIKTDVPAKLTGYYDPNQMVHVIRNLADNAVKYTPEGGLIEIGARNDGHELVIWVKDTGIGIPYGEVERVFGRFYRVDKARSRRLGGTGLGLAIVKDIVESHGGRVSVETELGNGSTFTVTLPESGETP